MSPSAVKKSFGFIQCDWMFLSRLAMSTGGRIYESISRKVRPSFHVSLMYVVVRIIETFIPYDYWYEFRSTAGINVCLSDDSHKHAGHAGMHGKTPVESHFSCDLSVVVGSL